MGTGASGSAPRKRRRPELDLDMTGVPFFLPAAGKLRPDVSEELAALLGRAGKAMMLLCFAMRKVGFLARRSPISR